MSVFRDLLMTMKNGGGLPSDYQQVEYIQSSGTQYINTGFKPTGDTSIGLIFASIVVLIMVYMLIMMEQTFILT